LITPAGSKVRPTSDRTRTALFNTLGLWIEGKKVLDLFAGSGCVGFECISRGAENVTFVEKNPAALKCINKNAIYLEETDNIDICSRDVYKFLNLIKIQNQDTSSLSPLPACSGSSTRGNKIKNSFDLIYADPPFRETDIISLVESIGNSKVAHEKSILVIEHEKRKEIVEGEIYSGFECYKNAKYGKAILSYFKVKSKK